MARFVATVLDPSYTPDASVALGRVNASLAATTLATGISIADLVASPSPTGPWGDALYASVPDAVNGASLVRISPSGVVTPLLTNLGSYGSVTFGPDGSLYFTDIARHSIHRMAPCSPP